MKVLNKNSTVRAPRRGGFSLAELMVVIVIIGLLVTLVAKNVLSNLGQAYETKARADISTIMGGLDDYAINNGMRYPDSLEALVTPDERGYTILRDDTVPTDPWGNEYQYEAPSGGQRDPIVYSLGSDGAQGGEGDAADLSSEDKKK